MSVINRLINLYQFRLITLNDALMWYKSFIPNTFTTKTIAPSFVAFRQRIFRGKRNLFYDQCIVCSVHKAVSFVKGWLGEDNLRILSHNFWLEKIWKSGTYGSKGIEGSGTLAPWSKVVY